VGPAGKSRCMRADVGQRWILGPSREFLRAMKEPAPILRRGIENSTASTVFVCFTLQNSTTNARVLQNARTGARTMAAAHQQPLVPPAIL
jgi:hypothetical protein